MPAVGRPGAPPAPASGFSTKRGDRVCARRVGQGGAELDIAVAGFRRGRAHAEGDDAPGARRHGRAGEACVQRRGVGDRMVGGEHPQHRVGVVFRHQQGGGGDRRGAVAPDRLQQDARRAAMPAARSCSAIRNRCSWLHTTIGGAKPSPQARSAVSCSSVRSDTSGQSCLGKLSRETGHSRVPEPPERMTGIMPSVIPLQCARNRPGSERGVPNFGVSACEAVDAGASSPSVVAIVGCPPRILLVSRQSTPDWRIAPWTHVPRNPAKSPTATSRSNWCASPRRRHSPPRAGSASARRTRPTAPRSRPCARRSIRSPSPAPW